MTKRKLLGLLLAATMIAGVFIGCSGNQSVSSQPQSGTSKIQDQPVEKKQLSLITAPASAPFPDGVTVDNSDILQFIEAKTGYDLEWKIFKTGEPIEQQANMLLVSNDAPDLIQMDPSPSIAGYARDGGLADLTDAFEKNGGTLKELSLIHIYYCICFSGRHYCIAAHIFV